MLSMYISSIDSPSEQTKFEKIYWTYRKLMYYIAYQILNNSQDAEDAVHDAFVKIAENISKIEEPIGAKTKAFVATIVENTSIDLYRKKKRRIEAETLEDMPGVAFDLEDKTALTSCMSKLSARYREVILLKYFYGFSNKEISKLMNITEANAIKLDQRAKQKFFILCNEMGVKL